jgi:hypothetical protein
MMTERQQRLWKQIQEAKADPNHDKVALKRLVHRLTEDDDLEYEMKAQANYRESRGGSRSPAFGKWAHDDE